MYEHPHQERRLLKEHGNRPSGKPEKEQDPTCNTPNPKKTPEQLKEERDLMQGRRGKMQKAEKLDRDEEKKNLPTFGEKEEFRGFAELPEDQIREELEDYSPEERAEVLRALMEEAELPKEIVWRLEQLEMVSSVFEQTLREFKQPKTWSAWFAKKGSNLFGNTFGSTTGQMMRTLKLDIESFFVRDYKTIQKRIMQGETFEDIAKEYPLIQRAQKKYQLDLSDPKTPEDLLGQKHALQSYYRGMKDYDRAAEFTEELLMEEFSEGMTSMSEAEDKELRTKAEEKIQTLASENMANWKNPSEEMRKQGAKPMSEDDIQKYIKMMTEEKYNQLRLKESIRKFNPDNLKGAKKQLWEQYNNMLDPQGDWLNIADATWDTIIEELAINAPLIILSGGIASAARAGLSYGARAAAMRVTVGFGRKTSMRALARLGARKTGQSFVRKKAAGTLGLLAEGAVFEATHSTLVGDLPESMGDWMKRWAWSCTALGLFHKAGKIGEMAFTKKIMVNGEKMNSHTYLGKQIAKLGHPALQEIGKTLILKGHLEAACMLVLSAAQNRVYKGNLDEFMENFGDGVLHAYITVGSLKVGHGVMKTAQGRMFKRAPKETLESYERQLAKKKMTNKQMESKLKNPATVERIFEGLLKAKKQRINDSIRQRVRRGKLPSDTTRLPLEQQLCRILGIQNTKLTTAQKRSILLAHFVGAAEGKGIGTYEWKDIRGKTKSLKEGEFTKDQRRQLEQELQLAGKDMPPQIPPPPPPRGKKEVKAAQAKTTVSTDPSLREWLSPENITIDVGNGSQVVQSDQLGQHIKKNSNDWKEIPPFIRPKLGNISNVRGKDHLSADLVKHKHVKSGAIFVYSKKHNKFYLVSEGTLLPKASQATPSRPPKSPITPPQLPPSLRSQQAPSAPSRTTKKPAVAAPLSSKKPTAPRTVPLSPEIQKRVEDAAKFSEDPSDVLTKHPALIESLQNIQNNAEIWASVHVTHGEYGNVSRKSHIYKMPLGYCEFGNDKAIRKGALYVKHLLLVLNRVENLLQASILRPPERRRAAAKHNIEALVLSSEKEGLRQLTYSYFGEKYKDSSAVRCGTIFKIGIRLSSEQAEALFRQLQKHPDAVRSFFLASGMDVRGVGRNPSIPMKEILVERKPNYKETETERNLLFINDNGSEVITDFLQKGNTGWRKGEIDPKAPFHKRLADLNPKQAQSTTQKKRKPPPKKKSWWRRLLGDMEDSF